MIATLDQLKNALGITTNESNTAISNALTLGNSLIAGYIGYDVSDVDTVREYVYTADARTWVNFVHLPLFPVLDVVDIMGDDGVPIDPATYRVLSRTGRVDFFTGIPYGHSLPRGDYLTFHYHAGFNPVPDDLALVALNLGSTIYNNGGQITPQINQLKSLTMFDAMSMSFNTGDASVAGPDALIKSWAFILDRYAVDKGPVIK